MPKKNRFTGQEEERMERSFDDFKFSVKALRDASDKRTRMRVIYGDQVIQVD